MRLSDEIIPVVHVSRTSPARIWWNRTKWFLAVAALLAACLWIALNPKSDPEGVAFQSSETILAGGEE